MKVKIKTKDKYYDVAKLKCSPVEFLIIKRALRKIVEDRTESSADREKAIYMIKDMEVGE